MEMTATSAAAVDASQSSAEEHGVDTDLTLEDWKQPSWHHSALSNDAWFDGPTDPLNIQRAWDPKIAAVFIHAGAGYHSTANERIHLDACSDAARAGMKVLRRGGMATEAVEAAVRVLEDKEITNAGFGSNLAIDGTVECDATIVDHLGRSGACGAVPNIKNPIVLARLILQKSNVPLSLRRVPPNLLVGDGAKDFAWKHGMSIVPNDWLVSRNAKDRYLRWQEDLKRAEAQDASDQKGGSPNWTGQKSDRDHVNAIMAGTWNEGQPDSPAGGPATPSENGTPTAPGSPLQPRSPHSTSTPTPKQYDRSPLSFFGSITSSRAGNASGSQSESPSTKRSRRIKNNSPRNSNGVHADDMNAGSMGNHDRAPFPGPAQPLFDVDSMDFQSEHHDEDAIVDTVGAIAIDQWGHIAAGSSSGGIGMKHRGRVGPAALVGIGTAVIPADEKDPEGVVVAAVTSGTGEHMATTMASQKCAERLYRGTKRDSHGMDVKEDDESAILEAFVQYDFQEHPGVKNSASAGAIGAMAVKKTSRGYYLYFAHNTDSFALASMGSRDRDPHCVMSRITEGSSGVAQGARKIRVD